MLYADADDYANEFPDTAPPANVDDLLRVASGVVDRCLFGVAYTTDDTGLPADPDVAESLRYATCVIAAELATASNLAPGGSLTWDQVKIGSVSLGGRKPAEGATVVDGVPVPVLALMALRSVGQISLAPTTGGRLLYRVARVVTTP